MVQCEVDELSGKKNDNAEACCFEHKLESTRKLQRPNAIDCGNIYGGENVPGFSDPL